MAGDGRSKEPLSVAIVWALAEKEGVSPTELGYSLQEYIDAEALDALAEHRGTEWLLRFAVEEYTITVNNDGYIDID